MRYWDEENRAIILINITSIGDDTFNNCCLLKKVVLPSTITYIDRDAFVECTSLKKLEIPNVAVSIADGAFYGCDELKEKPRSTKGCPKDYRFCGACAYWAGERVLDERGVFIKIKEDEAQCKCTNDKCRYSQEKTSYKFHGCHCFKAWGE